MATTYFPIAKTTVGSGGAATIEFTSIPQVYTDLQISISSRDSYSATSTAMYLQFNNNSSNHGIQRLRGGSGTVDAYRETAQSSINLYNIKPGALATNNVFGSASIYILNYASSNYKSVSVEGIGENNSTDAYSVIFAGSWLNTSAITSIKLYSDSTFVQYSTATLYGIKKD